MKTTRLRSSVFMAAALLLLPFVLIACRGPALTGYFSMDSYDQLKREYSKWHESAIYPDMPDIGIDESTLEYKAFYTSQIFEAKSADEVEITSYSIEGCGEVDGFQLSCRIGSAESSRSVPPPDTCREEGESEEIRSYKGIDVVFRSSEFYDADNEPIEDRSQHRDYSDRYAFIVNGNLYSIWTTVRKADAESSEKRDMVRDKINDIMYSWVCGVIDEAQNNIAK